MAPLQALGDLSHRKLVIRSPSDEIGTCMLQKLVLDALPSRMLYPDDVQLKNSGAGRRETTFSMGTGSEVLSVDFAEVTG